MLRQITRLFGSAALAAILPLTAAAQVCSTGGVCPGGPGPGCSTDGAPANVYGPEYSNGGACKKGRGPAIVTPVEAFGVHPPGLDPADANRCFLLHKWRQMWIPYYAPLSPTSTSARWQPTCYFPLMPYYTPYYCGYCPHRLCTPEPPPYGFDGGWGPGPLPGQDGKAVGKPPLNYGVYTSVLQDDTIFWNMGGNGLVPYGAPRPPHGGPPDLVDMIQVSRKTGGGHVHPSPDGAPVTGWSGQAAPAILPPTEKPDDNGVRGADKESKEAEPALAPPVEEKPAPPE